MNTDGKGRGAQQVGDLETKMATGFAGLEAKTAALRAAIIKWMFLFWVGQLTVMTGLFLAFFRH